MSAKKKYKRKRDRPFSALPRRGRYEEHYFPMMYAHKIDWSKVFADRPRCYILDLLTPISIDSKDYEWEVLKLKSL